MSIKIVSKTALIEFSDSDEEFAPSQKLTQSDSEYEISEIEVKSQEAMDDAVGLNENSQNGFPEECSGIPGEAVTDCEDNSTPAAKLPESPEGNFSPLRKLKTKVFFVSNCLYRFYCLMKKNLVL